MEILKTGTTVGKARAALAIFFLVHQKPHQEMASICIPLLVDLMTNDDETCKLNAIKALGALAVDNKNNKNEIVAKDAVKRIIQHLREMKKNTHRIEVSMALGRIAGTLESDNAIIENGGLNVLAMVLDGSEPEKAGASEALTQIFGSIMMHSQQTSSIHPKVSEFLKDIPGNMIPTLITLQTSTIQAAQQSSATLLSQLGHLGVQIKMSTTTGDRVAAINGGLLEATQAISQLYSRLLAQDPTLTAKQLEPAIPGLLSAARTPNQFDASSQSAARKLLMFLLVDSDMVAKIAPHLDKAATVTEFCFAMKEPNHILRMCADAIWCVLEYDLGWEDHVADASTEIAGLLEKKDDDLMRAGLSILRIIAFSDPEGVVCEPGVGALVSIIMEQEDTQLKALAAQVLWVIIVSGNQQARDDLVKEGILSPLPLPKPSSIRSKIV